MQDTSWAWAQIMTLCLPKLANTRLYEARSLRLEVGPPLAVLSGLLSTRANEYGQVLQSETEVVADTAAGADKGTLKSGAKDR
jgi:hypothetical protein